VARVLPGLLEGLVAIPLEDADPAVIELAGHEDRRNPLVTAILAFAKNIRDSDPSALQPEASDAL
jgi:hypothetical protein